MNWARIKEELPEFVEGVESLEKRFSRILKAALGSTNLFDDEDDLEPSDLLAILLWKEWQTAESHYQEILKARLEWLPVGTYVADGVLVRSYKNTAGDLADVPDAFVVALLAGVRLDARIEEDLGDPSMVRLLRGRKEDARFPKSLLGFLAKQAEKNLRDSPGNPTSRPASHAGGTGRRK